MRMLQEKAPRMAGAGLLVEGEQDAGTPSAGLLDEIVRRIVQVAEPERIVLFGSAARGQMGPDSDLDLLIVRSGVTDTRALATEVRRSLRGLGTAFDIVVATPDDLARYGDSPALLFREAIGRGRTLYAR
jgi:uncharacterized protein